MEKRLYRFAILGFGVALGLVGVLTLMETLGTALAQSGTGIIRVTTGGSDAPGCGSATSPCATVQYAVDEAAPGDVIEVATGVYTGVQGRLVPVGYSSPPASGLITQVVYISKTVAVRGGYTTAFAGPPDPQANPTTLDAEGLGRVIVVAGEISPTIEGLRLTNGNAAGLGGRSGGGAGGGVYVISATATISDCRVFSNTAFAGSGLYLDYGSATLGANSVASNTASGGGGLFLNYSDAALGANIVTSNIATGSVGGGLCLYHSNATLNANSVISNVGGGLDLRYSSAALISNVVASNYSDSGGGVCLEYYSSAALTSNVVISNTAKWYGGGLYIEHSTARLISNSVIANTSGSDGGGLLSYYSTAPLTITGNMVLSNTSSTIYGMGGGGLSLIDSDATLSDNVVAANRVISSEVFGGGGILVLACNVTLSNNTVISNTSNEYGGGILLHNGSARLSNNTVISNTANRDGGISLSSTDATLGGNKVIANTASLEGGGLSILGDGDFTLTNNVVADNRAGTNGSGLYIQQSSPRLLHTTIARNSGGDGSGVHVVTGTAWLTDTILVSQTVGITANAGSTANMSGTLWYGNANDRSGAGTINHTGDYTGDPAFVNPDGGDYHIGVSSAAIDKGVNAGVTTDMDGDLRPQGSGYDLGADEFTGTVAFTGTHYLPVVYK